MTTEGRRAVDAAIERLVTAEDALLSDLSDDDRRRLTELLRTLSLTLGG
jgi:DNA-binding MarR family transcriptional regulator